MEPIFLFPLISWSPFYPSTLISCCLIDLMEPITPPHVLISREPFYPSPLISCSPIDLMEPISPSPLISWNPFPSPIDFMESILLLPTDLMEPFLPFHIDLTEPIFLLALISWSPFLLLLTDLMEPILPLPIDLMEPISTSPLISYNATPHRFNGVYFPSPHWSHGNRSPLHTDFPENRDNWSSYSTGYWSSAGSRPSRRGCFSLLALGRSVADRLAAFWPRRVPPDIRLAIRMRFCSRRASFLTSVSLDRRSTLVLRFII